MSGYEVGQRVWVYGINDRGRPPTESTVVKVGRALVSVQGPYGDVQQFRMDTGQSNSRDYPHHFWIRSDDERAVDERLAAINDRLMAAGVHFAAGVRLPVEVLEAFVTVLDDHGIGGAA